MSTTNSQITVREVEDSIGRHSGMIAMQSQLRQAVFDGISTEDVTEIVKKQIEKAKQGDDKSLQFVMKYVLGFGQSMTLQQVNVVDTETAASLLRNKER